MTNDAFIWHRKLGCQRKFDGKSDKKVFDEINRQLLSKRKGGHEARPFQRM